MEYTLNKSDELKDRTLRQSFLYSFVEPYVKHEHPTPKRQFDDGALVYSMHGNVFRIVVPIITDEHGYVHKYLVTNEHNSKMVFHWSGLFAQKVESLYDNRSVEPDFITEICDIFDGICDCDFFTDLMKLKNDCSDTIESLFNHHIKRPVVKVECCQYDHGFSEIESFIDNGTIIASIVNFMYDGFKVNIDGVEYYFSELPTQQRVAFLTNTIHFVVV